MFFIALLLVAAISLLWTTEALPAPLPGNAKWDYGDKNIVDYFDFVDADYDPDRREVTVTLECKKDFDVSEATYFLVRPLTFSFYDAAMDKLEMVRSKWSTIPPGGPKGTRIELLLLELPNSNVIMKTKKVIVRVP